MEIIAWVCLSLIGIMFGLVIVDLFRKNIGD